MEQIEKVRQCLEQHDIQGLETVIDVIESYYLRKNLWLYLNIMRYAEKQKQHILKFIDTKRIVHFD